MQDKRSFLVENQLPCLVVERLLKNYIIHCCRPVQPTVFVYISTIHVQHDPNSLDSVRVFRQLLLLLYTIVFSF
jgi:hypothetical protein